MQDELDGNRGAKSPDDAAGAKRKSIKSVEIGIGLLNVLAQAERALRLRDIALLSGLSASQTHRYLLSFVNTGMVCQDGESGLYELGPKAITLGFAALRTLEPVSVGGQALTNLANETGMAGQLLIWGAYGPTIVRICSGQRFLPTTLQVGSFVPPMITAAGRVFLAYLPEQIAADAARTEWYNAGRQSTDGWRAVLGEIRRRVRADGYASVADNTVPGISAISAPIFDSQGDIRLALTLFSHHMDRIGENADLIASLRREAEQASERLGYPAAGRGGVT